MGKKVKVRGGEDVDCGEIVDTRRLYTFLFSKLWSMIGAHGTT
jgi:hypothetical protein